MRLNSRRIVAAIVAAVTIATALPSYAHQGPPSTCADQLAPAVSPAEVFARFSADPLNQFEWWKALPDRPRFSVSRDLDLSAVQAHELALENGAQELRAVRVNFNYTEVAQRLLTNYLEVMQVLPKMELWVVLQADQADTFAELLKMARYDVRQRVKVVTSTEKVEVWAQDGSKPLAGKQGTLVQNKGVVVDRDVYRVANKALTNSDLSNAVESQLPFEGGNVIVGARHVFIGPDFISRLMMTYGASRPELLSAYAKQFGKPVIEVGVPLEDRRTGTIKLEAASFHVDLSMAVGRNLTLPGQPEVIFLQSPLLMLKDVFGMSGVESMSASEFQNGLSSHLNAFRAKSRRQTPAAVSLVTEVLGQHAELLSEELKARQLARRLTAEGYTIQWIPGFNNGVQDPTKTNPTRSLKTFNYTNVIFSGNKVLIPQLGVPELDQAAVRAYQKMGYSAIPMDIAAISLIDMGGPRCLSETYR